MPGMMNFGPSQDVLRRMIPQAGGLPNPGGPMGMGPGMGPTGPPGMGMDALPPQTMPPPDMPGIDVGMRQPLPMPVPPTIGGVPPMNGGPRPMPPVGGMQASVGNGLPNPGMGMRPEPPRMGMPQSMGRANGLRYPGTQADRLKKKPALGTR